MKKRSIIGIVLIVMVVRLAVIGLVVTHVFPFFSDRFREEASNVKITMDFSMQTNGRWEYLVAQDSGEADTWQDQIYTDPDAVGREISLLVPPVGQTKTVGGWTENREIYICPSGPLQLYATGLESDVRYEVTLFYPLASGDRGIYTSSVTGENPKETIQVLSVDFSCFPGWYRNLTLVISGNGETYTHTFHMQLQNVSGQQIRDRNAGILSGLYFNGESASAAEHIGSGELLGQVRPDRLYFELSDSQNVTWNEDHSSLTLTEATGFPFVLKGVKPDVIYRCALIGEIDGRLRVFPIPVQTENDTASGSAVIPFSSGEFKDAILLAYGGGERTVHSFSGEIKMSGESGNTPEVQRDTFVPTAPLTQTTSLPETGYRVDIPADSVFSGYVGCELSIPIAFSKEYKGTKNLSVFLFQEETGRILGELSREIQIGDSLREEIRIPVSKDFDPGACSVFLSLDGQNIERRIILLKEQTPLQVIREYQSVLNVTQTLSTQGAIRYEEEESIIPEINAFLDSMEGFDADMFHQFRRYRYAESQEMIGSFAMTSPNVPETEQTIDREDLVFTVNWLLMDFYMFQYGDMKNYTDAQVIHAEQMKAFLGEDSRELTAMDYATGFATDAAGTVYIWIPVYYEDDQGGLVDGQLYLFVYILHQGADTVYLDSLNYYDPDFYNDYHTTKLLITDQKAVAGMIAKLCQANRALFSPEDSNDYPTLSQGMKGEYVRRLQLRLQRLGYLSTSVDAVFSRPVEEAVQAWKQDMGLAEGYEVTPEMQRMLHDNSTYRKLLMDWLQNLG